jgi:putative DNA primase/helicase
MQQNFLDLLWPKKPDGFLCAWAKKSAPRFFHTSEFSEAHDYMTAMADYDDVYFGVGLLAKPPMKGRGTANNVAYLPAMHADFDMLGVKNVHAKGALPVDFDDLVHFLIETDVPQPSVCVNSGNGAHAYWIMEEALDLTKEEGRLSGSKMLKDFQRSIIQLAKKHRGWEFDTTSDLARVLRYPGTKNHKTFPPKNVEII